MCPSNACSMAIGLFKLFCILSLTRREKRQHLLFRMQGHASPFRSCAQSPTGADFTIALRELHFDKRFACILDWGPTRTDLALWTGDRLSFPIDGKMRQVMAGLSLIPMRFERRAN